MLSSSTWFWLLNLHMSSRQSYRMNSLVRGGLFLLPLLPAHFFESRWILLTGESQRGGFESQLGREVGLGHLGLCRSSAWPASLQRAAWHQTISNPQANENSRQLKLELSSVEVRKIWEETCSHFSFFAVCVSPTFRTNQTLSWDSPSVQHVFSKRGELFATNLGGLSSVPSVPGLRRKWSEIWSAIFSPRPSFQCLALYRGVVGRVLQRCVFTFLFRIIPYKSDSVEHEAPRWKKSILKSPSRSPTVVPIIWIFGESRCTAVPWASICLGHMIVNTWRREIALPCFQSCRIVMTTHLARCSNMWQLNTWFFPRRIHTNPSFFKPLLGGAHETTLCLRTFSFTVL